MLTFYAVHFLACLQDVGQSEFEILLADATSPATADWIGIQQRLRERLERLSDACRALPISKALLWQVDSLAREASLKDNHAFNIALVSRLQQIRTSILLELVGYCFYAIPEEQAGLMEEKSPHFGESVQKFFPDTARDIYASARCLALNEWTACVFHCMRVLEHGLRSFASSLSISLGKDNWGTIIEQIEKAIRELARQQKGATAIARLQFCSEAASQFRYFKDAWRNHAMHATTFYSPEEAQSVWTHTKAFMENLAENLAA